MLSPIQYDEDQEQVAHKFEKYGFILMPVVDEENHMLGVIEFDDIMDVIQEENTEDIHHLGGVNKEERVDSTLKESFQSRIPWLIVNLFTAVLAAATVSMFETTISKVCSTCHRDANCDRNGWKCRDTIIDHCRTWAISW